MCVADFFAARARGGRAPLGRCVTRLETATWIARAAAHGRVSYWLCRRDQVAIELLDPTIDVGTIRTTAQRRRRATFAANTLTGHARLIGHELYASR